MQAGFLLILAFHILLFIRRLMGAEAARAD
jgi:hypothetical protein